jgi:hypothetical protein
MRCGLEDAKAEFAQGSRRLADTDFRPDAIWMLSWGGLVASANC